MQQLINKFRLEFESSYGRYWWRHNAGDKLYVLGRYNSSIFSGSDRLSMSIMADNDTVKPMFKDRIIIAEGDRFSNNTFIAAFNPIIIRVKGDGKEGRTLRNSSQTERQIKSIATKVDNLPYHYLAANSAEALTMLINDIEKPVLNNNNPLYLSGKTSLF